MRTPPLARSSESRASQASGRISATRMRPVAGARRSAMRARRLTVRASWSLEDQRIGEAPGRLDRGTRFEMRPRARCGLVLDGQSDAPRLDDILHGLASEDRLGDPAAHPIAR